MSDRLHVLFVCLGNICRSPLAEAVFRHQVREAGLEQHFRIDSAGTSSWHEGEPPDARAALTARRRGIVLEGSSRPIRAEDLQEFDYVVVMDRENLEAVERLVAEGGARAEVALLRSFDPEAEGDLDVPDPYFGGESGFERVQDIVERSCKALLQHIRAERAL